MGVLDAEVALYETLRADLEQGHKGEWALSTRMNSSASLPLLRRPAG